MNMQANLWFLKQLGHLAATDPEQYSEFLRLLQQWQVPLFERLALDALEEGLITPAECADALGWDLAVVDARLVETRAESGVCESRKIAKDQNGTARIAESQVTVWEVVREFRRVGSIAKLQEEYSSLTEAGLRAALSYAGNHPDEIADKIREYEDFTDKARAAYQIK